MGGCQRELTLGGGVWRPVEKGRARRNLALVGKDRLKQMLLGPGLPGTNADLLKGQRKHQGPSGVVKVVYARPGTSEVRSRKVR